MLAKKIRDALPEQDLLSYLEAVLRVYNLHGRRDNIYKARIKILVHEIGAAAFTRQVEEEWLRIRDGALKLPQAEIERINAYFAPPAFERRPAKAALRAPDRAFDRWVTRNTHAHKQPGYAIVTISLKPIGGIPGDASAGQMDAIADLGYERASLAEIAKRAKVSKSVISYYFAGKDELIEQVVTDVYTAAGAYMMPQLMVETTASGTLRKFIVSNVTFIAEHLRDVQAMIEIVSSARTPDGQPRFDIRGLEEPISGIEQMLRWGQERGEFRSFEPSVMAVAIRTTIDALGPRLLVYPELDPARYAEELATTFKLATRAETRRKKR
jgi:AcrR family transcriptional regulator